MRASSWNQISIGLPLGRCACERSGSRRSFFERRDGAPVLGGMAGTRADVRKADRLEQLADRALVIAHAKRSLITRCRSIRRQRTTPSTARSGPVSTSSAMSVAVRRRGAARVLRPNVGEPIGTMLIEPVHPIPQRLPVHAADPGRLGAIHPVNNCSQLKQATTLTCPLGSSSQPPQFGRRKVLTKLHR